MVDVVRDADAHSARVGVEQRPNDRPLLGPVDPQVVESESERALGRREERRHLARDLERRLLPVEKRPEL